MLATRLTAVLAALVLAACAPRYVTRAEFDVVSDRVDAALSKLPCVSEGNE